MITHNRENGGKLVRVARLRWARRQPNPKASWLLTWEEMDESDKEADRCIWDEVTSPYLQAIRVLVAQRDHMMLDKEKRL